MVRVRFSAVFHQITREREVQIELGNPVKLRELIRILVERYGNEFESRILEGGKLRRFVNIFLNGEDIRELGELEAQVEDKDEVVILPAVVGG